MNLRTAIAVLSIPKLVALIVLGGPALAGYMTLRLASISIGNAILLVTVMLWGFWLLCAHRVVVAYAPQVRDNGDFLLPWTFFTAPALMLIGGLGLGYGGSTGAAAIISMAGFVGFFMGGAAYIAGGCGVMMAFRKARLGVAKLGDAPAADRRHGNRRAALFAFPPIAVIMFGDPLAQMTNAVRAKSP